MREVCGGKDFFVLIFWYFWIKPVLSSVVNKVRKELALKQGVQPMSCHALFLKPGDTLGSGPSAFGAGFGFKRGCYV